MPTVVDLIKQLRLETGAGVADIRDALEESGRNLETARSVLSKQGKIKAEKKAGQQTTEGAICSYIHSTGRVGVLLEIDCETDFVAKNSEFQKLAKEVALQIAAMNPADADDLLAQEYIRDANKKIGDLVAEVIAKTGENIKIRRFMRYEVGEVC